MKADEFLKRIRELHGQAEYTDEQLADERWCERSRNEMDAAKKVEDAIKVLIDAANSFDKSILVPSIVSGLIHGHRYLQNELIECLIEALGTYGDLPSGSFVDGRNEMAHKWCKKIREVFADDIFWRDSR